jgi:hypothetical protein
MRMSVIVLSCFFAGMVAQEASAAIRLSSSAFPLVQMASSTKKHVNATPSHRAAITFVTRDNIAFAMPFTACAGSKGNHDAVRPASACKSAAGSAGPCGHLVLSECCLVLFEAY